MKRAVVTGGTGFVGANLARRLLADGHAVHLLVRPGYAPWRIAEIEADVEIHEVGLLDVEGLTALLAAIRPDWLFHLAAYGAYPSQGELPRMIQTNFLGTVSLVQASLSSGFEAFVNVGSSSEYGFKDHAPSETEWIEPNSAYAVTKASATLFCRYVAQTQRVRIPTLRLYSVYGPYEEPSRLIPTVAVRGLQGRLPALVGPEVARDFVEVSDVCEACIRAASFADGEPGAVYNVGTGVQTTLRDVVELARRRFEIIEEPAWGSMPARVWDTSIWKADIGRIQRELGWRPSVSFEHGFERLVDWLLAHPRWRQYYTDALDGHD